MDEPVRLFEAFESLLHASDWRGAAALCDPTSLMLFKKSMLEHLTPENPVELTAEEWMRHNPDMPLAVAEWHIEQMARQRSRRLDVSDELAGVDSLGALGAMPPEDVFAAWLEAHTFRSLMRAAMRRGEIPQSQSIDAEAIEPFRYTAIGAVRERNLSYILYHFATQESADDASRTDDGWNRLSGAERAFLLEVAEPPAIVTARLQPSGEWRMVAEYNFMNMANRFFGFEAVDNAGS